MKWCLPEVVFNGHKWKFLVSGGTEILATPDNVILTPEWAINITRHDPGPEKDAGISKITLASSDGIYHLFAEYCDGAEPTQEASGLILYYLENVAEYYETLRIEPINPGRDDATGDLFFMDQ